MARMGTVNNAFWADGVAPTGEAVVADVLLSVRLAHVRETAGLGLRTRTLRLRRQVLVGVILLQCSLLLVVAVLFLGALVKRLMLRILDGAAWATVPTARLTIVLRVVRLAPFILIRPCLDIG